MSFKISGNFFASFELHDNVQYNLNILRTLYTLKKDNPESSAKLIKPIVILEVSIIEAVLHDFYLRIKTYRYETVENVSDAVRAALKGKEVDNLAKYIDQAKKHDFFKEKDNNFYSRLHDLREARNRVHIQNAEKYKPVKETDLFDGKLLRSSEKCLEKVLKTISERHPRPENISNKGYMKELELPWSSHL